MIRKIFFQVHWLLGITAGVVLVLVGVTGAMLSFEDEILKWLNAGTRTVTPGLGEPLPAPELLDRLRMAHPDRRILALTVSGDPAEAARVTLAPQGAAGDGPREGPPGRGPRGETCYANPHTGALLDGDGARGETFFRTTMQLHRWLTAGGFGDRDIGRQIVGACTLALIIFALSGLYLRWPRRRGRDWRAWLTFDPRLKGRHFLWHLHAIAGTWVLVPYLVLSLTGLYWSYEWYREGLDSLAGVERSAPRGQRDVATNPGGATSAEITAAWQTFLRETRAPGYATATLSLTGAPVEIRYLDADPPHERAFNTLQAGLDGEVLRHERYDDQQPGARLIASIFPLHSGSFFGLAGVVLFMLASLAMPLFAVTGWMLYLDRRQRKLTARAPSIARSARPGRG